MTTALLAVDFWIGKAHHAARRAWCFLAHDTVRATNQPPQVVCGCGIWRYPGEEVAPRRTALTVSVMAAVVVLALLAVGCGDVLTAPTQPGEPVIVDDGGLQPHSEGSGEFDGGSALAQ